MDRIEAVDKNGAKLNAVIEINPDAIALAKAMDLEIGKSRGPLHGIVLIKDNIDTGDEQTTAGSLALVGNIASNDTCFYLKKNKGSRINW
jgi:amidase